MVNISCIEKCCQLQVEFYKSRLWIPLNIFPKTRKRKAGIFVYDPSSDKILIVQSRGRLWGSPKGTVIDDSETNLDCALRELKEETGLDIKKEGLGTCATIKNWAHYYYVELPECTVSVQTQIKNNDANGVGWIKIACLRKMVERGYILVNHHLRLLIKIFLDETLPYIARE